MEIHGQGNASRLRERRLQRGMTQQEVAEALERLAWLQQSQRVGVNPDMVSKWERGTKRPSRLYLRLLCALFEVTPAQLGYGDPSRRSLPLSRRQGRSRASWPRSRRSWTGPAAPWNCCSRRCSSCGGTTCSAAARFSG